MTVKELRHRLAELPDDLLVWTEDEQPYEIEHAQVEWQIQGTDGEWNLTYQSGDEQPHEVLCKWFSGAKFPPAVPPNRPLRRVVMLWP